MLVEGKYRVRFNLPHAPMIPPENFIGREKQLQEIEKVLQPGRLLSREKPLVLHGLRGVGKTQLALRYAYKHKYDYTAVLWIRCKTQASLLNDIANFAASIPSSTGDGGNDRELVMNPVDPVFNWLKKNDNSGWLIIFDNLIIETESRTELNTNGDPPFDLRQYLKRLNKGTIIITSSLSSTSKLGVGQMIPTMDINDSVKLLDKTSGGGCKQKSGS